MATIKEAIRKIHSEIRDLIVSRQDLSYKQVGRLFDISETTVVEIVKKFDLPRRKAGRKAMQTRKGS